MMSVVDRRFTLPDLQERNGPLLQVSASHRKSSRKSSAPRSAHRRRSSAKSLPDLFEITEEDVKNICICGSSASNTFLAVRKEIEQQRIHEKVEKQKQFQKTAQTAQNVNKFKNTLIKSWLERKAEREALEAHAEEDEELNKSDSDDDSEAAEEIMEHLSNIPNCSEEMRKQLYKRYLETSKKRWAKKLHFYKDFKYVFQLQDEDLQERFDNGCNIDVEVRPSNSPQRHSTTKLYNRSISEQSLAKKRPSSKTTSKSSRPSTAK